MATRDSDDDDIEIDFDYDQLIADDGLILQDGDTPEALTEFNGHR